jgi:hypothetical protein
MGRQALTEDKPTMSKTISKTRFWFFILIIIFLLSCTPKPKWEGMSQAEYVKFPELGVLGVGVQAIEGQLPKLIIRNSAKTIVFQIEMGHTDDPHPENFEHLATIKFKVLHIPGLPDPLLMVVAAGPGGSDSLWEMTLIGVVSGKIRPLWKQTKGISNAGGFFVGDLGKGRGVRHCSVAMEPMAKLQYHVFNPIIPME